MLDSEKQDYRKQLIYDTDSFSEGDRDGGLEELFDRIEEAEKQLDEIREIVK